MRVAVIGAGIGGLSTAVGLQRAGADMAVLERLDRLRPGGSGLSILGNGRAALTALGLSREFDALTSETAGLWRGGMRTPNGAWVKTFPADTVRNVRVIHREDLHNLLSSQLEPGTLHLGIDISALSITGETWGRHQRFGIAPLPDGRVYWFAVDSRPARATGPGVSTTHGAQREVLERFGAWHSPIPELVDATDSTAIHWLPIHELGATLPSFRYGRAALVGDAAHAMTPNLGQGGNQALEDAATLTVLLQQLARQDSPRSSDIDDALAEYDRLRSTRTQRIARQSRLIGDAANLQGQRTSTMRDVASRFTPTWALRRQFSAIHDWAPPPQEP